MTSTAWANPYYLHPWFKMPSLKRKDLSSDEEDASTTPIRAASLEPRRSLSPAPSPKRRRCDVLESGMSQLTLDGRPIPPSPAHFAPGQFPSATTPAAAFPTAPTVQFPDAPQPSIPQWTDARLAPNVTQLPITAAPTSVVLPGSVEEPTSPEAVVEEDAEVPEVSMKVPSWYEIEKDRTSTLPPSSSPPIARRPPRPTVVDASSSGSSRSSESGDTGIVITDLEDSDSEDSDAAAAASAKARSTSTAADADGDSPQFTISSALLDRLPKPHTLGPLAPESSSAHNALVLYRPLPLPVKADDGDADRDTRTPREERSSPSIEEAVVETEDVPIMEDEPIPMDDQIEFTPIVESVGEPADEPMDIEML
ncbi:hypothetical protein GY45DRAFT_1317396 [Cubamyces sp. BRFM 1775]|nr:hypothetical protein GY45DRAFT_1317396 [Cubamyces sp. BRFM 1775]